MADNLIFELNEPLDMHLHLRDADMLKLVGRGVIMQNAPEEIKKQMEYITKSNNEDGIYEYLQKLDLV